MDFDLQSDIALAELPGKLNEAMPEGLVVKEAYEAAVKFREMAWLQIEGDLLYDKGGGEAKAAALTELFKRKAIPITRKTKKGMGEADIAPMIAEIRFTAKDDKTVGLSAIIHAQEPTLNPAYLISAVSQHLPAAEPDFFRYTRKELYDKERKIFR